MYVVSRQMTPTERKQWAREEILSWIDSIIKEEELDVDVDEMAALKKERDRIAKFLKGRNSK